MKLLVIWSRAFLMTFFVSIQFAEANHIVGGELEMANLSPNVYRVQLNLYLDQFGSTTPSFINKPSYTVTVHAKSNHQFIQSIEVLKVGQSTVPYGSPFCAIGGLGTVKLTYSAFVQLNPLLYSDTNGYYLLWYGFARNLSITNIISPGSTGQVFYTEFPSLFNAGGQPVSNSSPTNLPIVGNYACVGQAFSINYAGIDPDNDSLVYSLTTPGNSIFGAAPPYSLVNWAPGISVTNMIPGPQPLQITPSGTLSFTSSTLGLYLFGVKIEEYRNGKKIGELIRDFQIFVLPCQGGVVTPKVYAVEEDGFTLTRSDTIVLPPNQFCVNLKGVDADTNSQLLIDFQGVNFSTSNIIPQVSIASTNNTSASDTANFSFCLKSSCGTRPDSLYQVRVLLKDNSCPFPRVDTIIFWVKAGIKPNKPPKLHHFNPATGQIIPPTDTTVIDQNNRCLSFYCVDVDTLTKLTLEVFALNFNLNLITQIQNSGFVNTTNSNDTIILSFCLPECSPLSNSLYRMRLLLNDQSCVPRLVDSMLLNVRVTSIGNNPPNIFVLNKSTGLPYSIQDTIKIDTLSGCITLGVVDYDTSASLNLSLTPVNFSGALLKPYQQQINTNYGGLGDTVFVDVCFETCLLPSQSQGIWQIQAQLSDISCPAPLLNNKLFQVKPLNLVNNKPTIRAFNPATGQILQSLDTLVITPSNLCIGVFGIDRDTLSKLVFRPRPLNFPLSYLQGFTNFGFVNSPSNPSDTTEFSVCLDRLWTCADSLLRLRLVLIDTGCGGTKGDSIMIILRILDTINSKPKLVFFDNKDPFKAIVSVNDTLQIGSTTNNCLQFYVVDTDTLTTLDVAVQLLSPSQPVLQSFSPLVQVNTVNDKDTTIATACFVNCNPNQGAYASVKIRIDDRACKKNGLDSAVIWVQTRNPPDNSPGIQVINPATQSPLGSTDTLDLSRSANCFTIKGFDPDTLTQLYLRFLPNPVGPNLGFNHTLSNNVNTVNDLDTALFQVCFPPFSWPCTTTFVNLRAVMTDSACHRNFSDTINIRVRLIGAPGTTTFTSARSSIDSVWDSGDTLFSMPAERCYVLHLSDPDTFTQLNLSVTALNFPSSFISPFSSVVLMNNGPFGSSATRQICLPVCTPMDTMFRFRIIARDQRCPTLSADTLIFTFRSPNPPNKRPKVFMTDSLQSVLLTGTDTLTLPPYFRRVNLRVVDTDTLSRISATFFPLNFSGSNLQVLQSTGTSNTSSANDTVSLALRLANCIPGADSILRVRMIYQDTGCTSKPDTVILHFRYSRISEPSSIISGLTNGQLFTLNPGGVVNLPTEIIAGDSSRINLILRTDPSWHLSIASPIVGPTTAVGSLITSITLPFNCDAAVIGNISLWVVAEAVGCQTKRDSVRLQLVYNSAENPPVIFTSLKELGPDLYEFTAIYDTVNVLGVRILSSDTVTWSFTPVGVNFPVEVESGLGTPGILIVLGSFVPTCRQKPGTNPMVFVKAVNKSCGRKQDSIAVKLVFREREQALNSLPNFITPNGDGLNEVFEINSAYWSCRFKSLKIMDRWGRQVYFSKDPEFRWTGDGLTGGQYFYFLEFEEKTVNGFIMLMR